jgi:hypothetical protein
MEDDYYYPSQRIDVISYVISKTLQSLTKFVGNFTKIFNINLFPQMHLEHMNSDVFIWYCTRPETICADTWKLACWQAQLAPASTVVYKGTTHVTASNEGTVLAGYISHPPAKDEIILCRGVAYVARQLGLDGKLEARKLTRTRSLVARLGSTR